MFKKFTFLIFAFLVSVVILHAQAVKNSFRIKITDNRNIQHNTIEYLFKNDSLKIFGISDYGKSEVNFLAVKLKKQQAKAIKKFIFSFPVDSLQQEYFDDFVNFGYITADHFPRVIEVEIRLGLKQYKSKATNAYVKIYATLFDFLNAYIPREAVRLQFIETDFKKTF